MMRHTRIVAQSLLFLIAFLWPWPAYLGAPPIGIRVDYIVLATLILLLVIDVMRSRRLRVPFELLWPGTILILLGNPGYLLFFAALHFSDSRREILRWFWVAGLSSALMAAVTILAPMAGAIPATFLLQTSRNTGALEVARREGLAMFTGLTVMVFLGFWRQRIWRRLLAAPSVLLLPAGLVNLLFYAGASNKFIYGASPDEWLGNWKFGIYYVVGFWLLARLIAKVEVARREAARETAYLYAMFLLTAINIAVFWGNGVEFLLGIVAAYAIPGRTEEASPWRWRFVLVVPFSLLIVWNLWHVDARNSSDPRNYMPPNRQWAASAHDGEIRLLVEDMEFVESRYPAERQTHLGLAHAELERGYVYRAAAEFAEAVRPVGDEQLILPPPSEGERIRFLTRLRERCSAMPHPERTFAYEQALIANGQIDDALSLLELRTAKVTEDHSLPRKPLEDAVVFLLRAESCRERFEEFTPSAFFALLSNWGAIVQQAPDELPQSLLPVVVAAQYGAHSEQLIVATSQGVWKVTNPSASRIEADEKDWPAGAWGLHSQDKTADWKAVLTLPGDKGLKPLVLPTEPIEAAETTPTNVRYAPDAPAIAIWRLQKP